MKHFFTDLSDWVKFAVLALVYAAVAFFFGAQAEAQSQAAAAASTLQLSTLDYNAHSIRVGVQPAVGEQKACVIYLEGLADSIRNHAPLFDALSADGYRVLAFDYYGQGGSSGSMNETRVEDALAPETEIGTLARAVWANEKACATSKKFVIGWSTGGLAAYKMAAEKWTDGVVLLAPGLVPKLFVGESAQAWRKMVFLNQTITARSLTRAENPPHVDPIHPDSPIKVPFFAKNLIFTSLLYREYEMPDSVKGLVLLSGDTDSYVDRAKTEKILHRRAPHFEVHSYPGALHELDNERPVVASDVRARTLKFFDSIR